MTYLITDEIYGVIFFFILGVCLFLLGVLFRYKKNIKQGRFLFLFSILWLIVTFSFYSDYRNLVDALNKGKYIKLEEKIIASDNHEGYLVLSSNDTVYFFRSVNMGLINKEYKGFLRKGTLEFGVTDDAIILYIKSTATSSAK